MVYSKYTNNKQNNTRKLSTKNLDTIRDKILLTEGDTVFDISDTAKSVKPFTNFVKRKAVNKKLNATDPQYGLCLKTYNCALS